MVGTASCDIHLAAYAIELQVAVYILFQQRLRVRNPRGGIEPGIMGGRVKYYWLTSVQLRHRFLRGSREDRATGEVEAGIVGP